MSERNKEELRRMQQEIEREINLCQRDLKRIGSLSIKVNSFKNLVAKESENNSIHGEFSLKSKYFQDQVRILSDKRTQEKQELEQEMESSKIRYKKITEVKDTSNDIDDKFFSQQSNKLDDFISKSMDSLRSLERQGGYIDNISNTVRRNFVNLGLGSDILYNIESRFAGDKSLFYILIISTILVILVLRFIF